MTDADFQPGFPERGEYPEFVANYVGLSADVTRPVSELEDQGTEFVAWCRALEPRLHLYRYEAGKWSVQQMLGHIVDTERVFAYRALRIARGDESLNPPFEQDDWVDAADHDGASWDGLVEEFRLVRASTVLLLRHLPEEAWMKRGAVSGGAITVRAMVHAIWGHLEHHRNVLKERYSES